VTTRATARKSPCASCPYRRSVPSGVWAEEEYDRLPKFDGEIIDQVMAGAVNVFMCHQGEGDVCSGWLAHRGDPLDLLAVRVALVDDRLDPTVLDYTTEVPLFASGAEAAAHGKAEIQAPGPKATATIDKIVRKRGL
jgi:hypothetical protein